MAIEYHKSSMESRYEGYKPQWEGFITLTQGDILVTSCGHGMRTGPDIVYIIIQIDGNFSCYCKKCERTIIASR